MLMDRKYPILKSEQIKTFAKTEAKRNKKKKKKEAKASLGILPAQRDSEGLRSLACYSSWGSKELDTA